MALRVILSAILVLFVQSAYAQISGLPRIPTSGGMGIQGSAGIGFVDLSVDSPSGDLKVNRGTMITASIERGFNFMHLYLTLGLNYMTAEGQANYRYTNLSSSATYSANDVNFSSSVIDLGLGLKLKLIDNYWFRPYIEGGGLGGYHQISYSSRINELAAQGSDYKVKDNVMGAGYYGEAGVEAMFSERFGVKLSARKSFYSTKALETLDNRALKFSTETYYFALLFGF